MSFASEPIQVVELVQPLCSRVFGSSPCLAEGRKCWNTDATCSYRAALDMTDNITLRFVGNNVYPWQEGAGAFQPSLAIPALKGYQTAPTVLNVSAGSTDKGALGYRAVCTAKIGDFPYNDHEVDPYVADRDYDPVAQGSFWSKWLARNPFHVGYTMRVYEGTLGDALADMICREYVVEKIDAGRDGVSITAKDILRKITDTGVTTPALSPGELSEGLNSSATTFQVAGAVVGDYQAAGAVRIGDELISYTGRADVGGNVEFTDCTRGAYSTEAASHDQDSRVQDVWVIDNEPFWEILYELLVTRGGIDAAYIDAAAWEAEFDTWRPTYTFTGFVTDPTKVDTLAAEICLQALSSIWWDERTQKIILRAQRPDYSINTVTDENDIIAGSFSIKERPDERASQVHVYYDLVSPVKSSTDKSSYRRVAAFVDAGKQAQYGGEPAVRELFCRFIQTGALANSIASTFLNRFKDVRRYATFKLAAACAGESWTGDNLRISHYLDVDYTGAAKFANWQITSAQASSPGSEFLYTVEDNASTGILWNWVDGATTPDFADATEDQKDAIGYWLDDDGNDADGTPRGFRWL